MDQANARICTATRFLLVSAGALILASCYSAAKTFEGFQDSSSDIESVVLLHEAVIQRDVQGKRHFIHEHENIRSLESINNAVKKLVIEKGYDVSNRSIWSIGLTEKPDTPVLVFDGNEGDWPSFFSDEKLVQESSPIWVQSLGFDESHIPYVGALHRQLKAESDLIREMKGTFYSSYTRMLNLPSNSVLLITQSFGEQIFTGKKVTEWAAIILGGLASGSAGSAVPQSDTTTHLLFILRSDTVG